MVHKTQVEFRSHFSGKQCVLWAGKYGTSLCTLFDLDKHLGSCYCVMILVLLQVEAVNYDENPCIQEFGISVGGKFEEVPARILDAPQLQYSVSKLYTTDS